MNDVLKASVEVSSFEAAIMPQHELEQLIKRKLAAQYTEHIMKNMNLTTQRNVITDTTTYTSSLVTSSFNGTSSVEKVEELRVVEFTKNGKVTRVELQRKTEHGWKKIPRIQIEE